MIVKIWLEFDSHSLFAISPRAYCNFFQNPCDLHEQRLLWSVCVQAFMFQILLLSICNCGFPFRFRSLTRVPNPSKTQIWNFYKAKKRLRLLLNGVIIWKKKKRKTTRKNSGNRELSARSRVCDERLKSGPHTNK